MRNAEPNLIRAWRWLAATFGFALAYMGAAELGHWLSVPSSHAAMVWPPAGLYLAVLLRSPLPYWPLLGLAAVAGNVGADTLLHGVPPSISLAFITANSLDAFAAAWLLRHYCGDPFRFDRLGAVLALTLVSTVVSGVLGAVIGAATITTAFGAEFWMTWRTWWVADLVGTWVVTPLILTLWPGERALSPPPALAALAEGILLLAGLGTVAVFLFGDRYHLLSMPFLLLPFLLWAALRFGLAGVAVVLAVLTPVTIRATLTGVGPFALPDLSLDEAVILAQSFLGVCALCFLALAALTEERKRSADALQAANDALEHRVQERTRALLQTAEQRRLAMEAAALGAWYYNPATRSVVGDERARTLFGLGPDDKIDYDRIVFDLVHPDDRDRVDTVTQQALNPRSDGRYELELRIVPPDGMIRWLAVDGETTFAGSGPDRRAVRMLGVVRDITAAKQAEHALRTSEERLSLAIDAAGMGTWDVDWRTGVAVLSETACRMGGLEPTVGARTTVDLWRSLVHPDDRPQVMVVIKTAQRQRSLYAHEYRIRRASDGHIIWVRTFGRFYYDDAGEPVRFIGVVFDNTERRQVEDALRESEQRFATLADGAPVLIWVNGPTGCDFVNRAYLDFLGIAEDAVQGDGWTRSIHPDDLQDYTGGYFEAQARRAPFEAQCRMRRHDGEYRWMKSSGRPRLSRGGEFLGYVGCTLDITELKEAQEVLQTADQRKNEFLAMLAHELRNPLAPILNAAQLIGLLGPAEPELQWAREVIERQARHLARLVDDLLDLSRVIQGKITLRKAAIDLAAVVEQALETSRPAIEARGHRLIVALPAEPLQLDADLMRLAQVLANLLDNAVKYTPPGGTLRLEAERDRNTVLLRVRDSGEGIPPALLERVFDLFTQARRTLDRAQGGLGIGLTIVRRLVELHGGTVEAFSEGAGKGSEFRVRLPLLQPAACPEPPGAGHGGAAQRVLVVEDNADTAQSLAMLLELAGYEVGIAGDGPAALGMAPEFRPQVILLDLGLPGMDGYEVARRLRALEATAGALLIAVTGYGRPEDRERTQAAGFDQHLVKPVDPQALIALVQAGVPLHSKTP